MTSDSRVAIYIPILCKNLRLFPAGSKVLLWEEGSVSGGEGGSPTSDPPNPCLSVQSLKTEMEASNSHSAACLHIY